mmetsp:Transcript_12904/g.17820  ORF Transcript_12904/g.17820 Transcript_12904/m.17820 type:complete len:98 (-) Transcript_12904:289-582(-)
MSNSTVDAKMKREKLIGALVRHRCASKGVTENKCIHLRTTLRSSTFPEEMVHSCRWREGKCVPSNEVERKIHTMMWGSEGAGTPRKLNPLAPHLPAE